MFRNKTRSSLAQLGPALTVAFVANTAHAAQWIVDETQTEALYAAVDAHPDQFAGVSVDEERRRVLVNYVRGTARPALANILTAVPTAQWAQSNNESKTSWTIALVPIERSMSKLDMVRDRLETVEPWATMVESVLVTHFVDLDRNVVAVGVTSISPELFATTRKTFGRDVELFITEPAKLHSRMDHFEAQFVAGGAAIIVGDLAALNVLPCTTGFAVQSEDLSGSHFLLTAGHCFQLVGGQFVDSVYDGIGNYMNILSGYQTGIVSSGNVISQGTPQPIADQYWPLVDARGRIVLKDAALIGPDNLHGAHAPFHPTIYEGAGIFGDTIQRHVVGTRTVRNGNNVCLSGSVSGTKCGRVIRTNVTVTFSDTRVTDNATVKYRVNGMLEVNASFLGGDSGGPVYTRDKIGDEVTGPDLAYAVGSIEGGTSTTTYVVPIAKMIPKDWELWTAICTTSGCTW